MSLPTDSGGKPKKPPNVPDHLSDHGGRPSGPDTLPSGSPPPPPPPDTPAPAPPPVVIDPTTNSQYIQGLQQLQAQRDLQHSQILKALNDNINAVQNQANAHGVLFSGVNAQNTTNQGTNAVNADASNNQNYATGANNLYWTIYNQLAANPPQTATPPTGSGAPPPAPPPTPPPVYTPPPPNHAPPGKPPVDNNAVLAPRAPRFPSITASLQGGPRIPGMPSVRLS